MTDFYSLDPQDQQVALAYAQAHFVDWLSQNRSRTPASPPEHLVFSQFLDSGVAVALDIRHRHGK